MAKKTKQNVSAARSTNYSSSPKARALPVEGVLVDPPQTTDDIVEKAIETSPAMSLLASRATKESEFDQLNLQVFSFVWAVPHLVRLSATELADDKRGSLVEMLKSGVSFRNVSNSEITIHANTPVAHDKSPGKVFARVSGFYAKGGKGKKADDVHVKPGQTVTFKVNWKTLDDGLSPLMEASNGRMWLNLITFAIEIKDVNQQTGIEPNALASIVSMIPKVHYTKRKSNPMIGMTETLSMQDGENFGLQDMPNGKDDLYSVYPISVESGGRQGQNGRNVERDTDIFTNTIFIQDAIAEGDLLGVEMVNVTKDLYKDLNEDEPCSSKRIELPRYYQTCGLTIRKLGGAPRALDLEDRQGGGRRLVLLGFTVGSEPNNEYATSYSYWKWDNNVGYWVLWDEWSQAPRYAPPNLSLFTPITSAMPMIMLTGIYTKKEQAERQAALMKIGKNALGQPFGEPRGFGSFLRKAVSVVTIVGQVAGFLGTLL